MKIIFWYSFCFLAISLLVAINWFRFVSSKYSPRFQVFEFLGLSCFNISLSFHSLLGFTLQYWLVFWHISVF